MNISSTNIWAYISSYSEEVTGSNIYIKANWSDGREVKFIIDCGLFQEKKWEHCNSEKFLYHPEEVEFAIATHFHTDHIGRFPYLMNEGFGGKIYTSIESKTMFPKMLNLTADILLGQFNQDMSQWKQERYARKSFNRRGRRDKISSKCKKKKFINFKSKDIENDKPRLIFTKDDVSRLQPQVVGVDFESTFSPVPGIDITFYRNGHLLGAAITLITLKYEDEELNILVTGDYSDVNAVTGVRSFVPEYVKDKVDIIISESTYGASPKVRKTTKDYELHLDLIRQTLQNNGTLVYMVNAIERPLVVLREIQYIMEHEVLGDTLAKHNIYFDSTFGITGLKAYDKIIGSEILNLPDNFIPITADDREKVLSELSSGKPTFLMLTSPQFYHGSFLIYADKLIQSPNVNMLFCSYVSECVSNIINLPRDIKIPYNGMELVKRCGMHKVGHFSSHASMSELDEFINSFRKVNTILFVHGTAAAKDNMTDYFSKDNCITCSLLKGKCIRVNRFGITKVY